MAAKPTTHRWPGRVFKTLVSLLALSFLAIVLLTDPSPAADPRPAPSAEQVQAGRDAASQLLAGRNNARGTSELRLSSRQLDGLGALATYGFRPDRLEMYAREGAFYVAASHALPWDRWLNVELTARKVDGEPRTDVRVGSVSFPNFLNPLVFAVGRRVMLVRGIDLPPFEELVRKFSVRDDVVAATIQLPADSVWFDRWAGDARQVEPALVAEAFCRLAHAQKADPETDFSAQVRRAFPAGGAATADPNRNRAAFIALAMLVVDKQVGSLAGLSDAQVGKCSAPAAAIALHGRTDLPKHFALSAAIAARAGVQLAEAMGEWKELSDSLTDQSRFARGDASGFSFVDLAADRSGFRVARAAISAAEARTMARRLSAATDASLLPPALLANPDGMKEADFVGAYGGIGDPRYLAAVEAIDAALAQGGLVGPQPR